MARSKYQQAVPRRVMQRLRRRILRRDGYRCRSCGRPGRLEVDHITPMARGGAPLDENNLQTLCRSCHIAKSIREKPMEDPERREWQEYLRAIAGGSPIS